MKTTSEGFFFLFFFFFFFNFMERARLNLGILFLG